MPGARLLALNAIYARRAASPRQLSSLSALSIDYTYTRSRQLIDRLASDASRMRCCPSAYKASLHLSAGMYSNDYVKYPYLIVYIHFIGVKPFVYVLTFFKVACIY